MQPKEIIPLKKAIITFMWMAKIRFLWRILGEYFEWGSMEFAIAY